MALEWALTWHIISICALGFLYLSMLFVLEKYINFIELIKKIKFIAPLIFMFVFNTLFTGVILAVLIEENSYFNVLIMVIALWIVFMLEIKRYKKQKVITSYNYISQVDFINFAKKVYIFDIFLLFFIYLII